MEEIQRTMIVKAALLVCLFMVWVAQQVIGADFQKGLDAAQKGDYTTAIEEWKPSAEQGNVDAQYNLGIMYNYGVKQRAIMTPF